MPRSVLSVIAKRESENEHKGDMISPTALTSCPRKLKLSRTTDYYQEPPRLYWAVRGALIHGFLETNIADVSTEKRVYKTVTTGPFAPWVISGRIDYYDHSTRTIEDYKTMSDKGIFVLFNGGVKPQHEWQVNVYRWLLWGGHIDSPDGEQVHWDVEHLMIHHMFMNQVLSTGKRTKQTLYQKEMPSGGKKFTYEIAKTRKEVESGWSTKYEFDVLIPNPKIKSHEEVEAYLAERGPERLRGFLEPDYMPEGVMNDAKNKWECGYCEVKGVCDKYEAAKAVEVAMKDDGLSNVIL
jgi:hypothetical protein